MRGKIFYEMSYLICILFACLAAVRGDDSFVVIFCTSALLNVIRAKGEKA